MYYRRKIKHPPANRNGHLYYVRLRTELGIFYKIGFTTMGSVEKRLNYKGSNDARYIDKVLLFSYLQDAYDVEQKLHGLLYKKRAFSEYSADHNFPLSKNGQTELYTEDVLNLDSSYTDSQRIDTEQKLHNKRLEMRGKTKSQDDLENSIVKLVMILFSPLIILLRIVIALFEKKNIGDELSEITDSIFNDNKKAREVENTATKVKVVELLRRHNLIY